MSTTEKEMEAQEPTKEPEAEEPEPDYEPNEIIKETLEKIYDETHQLLLDASGVAGKASGKAYAKMSNSLIDQMSVTVEDIILTRAIVEICDLYGVKLNHMKVLNEKLVADEVLAMRNAEEEVFGEEEPDDFVATPTPDAEKTPPPGLTMEEITKGMGTTEGAKDAKPPE